NSKAFMNLRSRVIALLFLIIPLPCLAQVGSPANLQPRASQPPALTLLLKPHMSAGKVDYVDGRLSIERPDVAAGGTLLRMPLLIAAIPTARYDGDAIKAEDARGEVPLKQQDEAPTPTGTYRRWLTSRATSGDVAVLFRAPPRITTPA